MPSRPILIHALALLLTASAVATAQTGAPASATGVRKDLIGQVAEAEQKFIALAEAMPAEKYGWRPAAGVRSVSEVFMHMVGTNYMLPAMAGVKRKPDVAMSADMETKVVDKAQVVELLRKSFAFTKQAMLDVPDDQLDTAAEFFGIKSTNRGVLVIIATHAHEHLGQSIAYARMNGVIPPWSRATGGGDR